MFCLVPLIRPTDIIKGVKKWQTLKHSSCSSYISFKPGEAVPSFGLKIQHKRSIDWKITEKIHVTVKFSHVAE